MALDETQLRQLIDAAESASIRGDTSEATRLLSAASAAAPEHALVLNARGVHALRRGANADARSLLDQAIARDPTIPFFYMNLATALRALGEPEVEEKVLQKALELDPYFSMALFQKASLFETLGKNKRAAANWKAGLASLRPGTQIHPSLTPIFERAKRAVQADFDGLAAFLNDRLETARQRHAAARQDRVDDCLAEFLGKKRIYVQQPTFTHFPRLPAISFFERNEFPWLAGVEAATDSIRSELVALLEESSEDFGPYVTHPDDAPLNQWKELNNSLRWSALFLHKDGRRIEDNIARCPATVAALATAPVVNIAARGPTAFFSRLDPKTHIPAHTGSSNTRLTVHIPLIVPAGCRFRVGSDIREWQVGTAFVFDDTIEHEAWNDSDEPRVVLIFDIWNPFLTEVERELMTIATASIADYYDETTS